MQTVATMASSRRWTMILLTTAMLWTVSTFAAVEFKWVRGTVNYDSVNQRLVDHVVVSFNNVPLVTMCAQRCLMNQLCASYNYYSAKKTCELNAASHVTKPTALHQTPGVQYLLRDSIVIDQSVLGPCAGNPCQNKGTCVTTTSSDNKLSALCLCTSGFTGSLCEARAGIPTWSDWGDFGACSTSCGDGVKVRRRTCLNTNGNPLSSQTCYGRDQEEQYCKQPACPQWQDWSDWGSCSTITSCGQGVRTQTRTCSNGGTAGVDRMCQGPVNETSPCKSALCNAPIRFDGGATYGEGTVSVFDDTTARWMPVCATGWDVVDANVACRQMGLFSGASKVTSSESSKSTSQSGTGSVATNVLKNMQCTGSETYLASCRHDDWRDTSCAAGPFAAVQCIVDGGWGAFTDWSSCSVTCGTGVQTRTRNCDYPPPLRGGKSCEGDALQTTPCTAAQKC